MSRTCARSHIHLSVYSACNFTKTGPNFLSFWWFQNLAVHTNTRWSTFSDRFHNVSFTMQSHDHNWSLSLKKQYRLQCEYLGLNFHVHCNDIYMFMKGWTSVSLFVIHTTFATLHPSVNRYLICLSASYFGSSAKTRVICVKRHEH